METTKVEGSLSEATSKVQEAAGDLLENAGTQISAKTRELGNKTQQLYTDFAGIVRESTVERPFAALAIAAGVGFLLGMLRTANRRRPDDSRRDWTNRD